MDAYLEQTVTAPPRMSGKIAYAAAWALLAVLAITAIVSLTNVISVTEESGFKFNFVALIVLAATVALGVFVYRSKDKLQTEYDYIISEDTLEVCGVYAQKRRKRLLRVNLNEITACGTVDDVSYRSEAARPGLRKMDFTLNDDPDAYFICFVKENARAMAVLEFNAEFRAHIEKFVRGQYGRIGEKN